MSSFCDVCGAVLLIQATSCSICGHHLQTASPSQHMALKSNSLLMQRYRILKKIGEGGFGLVYKAIDRKTGKAVAIKQITLASLSVQEIIEATDSYNREITLLTGLQHQNLPRIYTHFTDPEHWYVVMEYIEGETLEERLMRPGALRGVCVHFLVIF